MQEAEVQRFSTANYGWLETTLVIAVRSTAARSTLPFRTHALKGVQRAMVRAKSYATKVKPEVCRFVSLYYP